MAGFPIRFKRTNRSIWSDVIKLIIGLWVTNEILSALVSSIGQTNLDDNTGWFFNVYQFLGLTSGTTTGIIGIIGIIAVARLATNYLEFRL